MPTESRSPLSRRRTTDLPFAAPSQGGAHMDADPAPSGLASGTPASSERDAQAPPAASHIPRYLVLPDMECEGQRGPIPAVGAHRFKKSPSPVMGAAMSLLGFAAVTMACQPHRTVARRYQCTRLIPTKLPGRFPKV